MYAVDPAEVRETAEKLTVQEIVERLSQLVEKDWDGWVTLSGGNPALMPFGREWDNDLVTQIHKQGWQVSVETQGTVWRQWLRTVDHLTISPKAPSSGMWNEKNRRQMLAFLAKAEHVSESKRSLKVVVFDETDLQWAKALLRRYSAWSLRFLSVGTDQDQLHDEYALHGGIANRYKWLCEAIAGDPVFTNIRVLPQLHVIAWGAKRGCEGACFSDHLAGDRAGSDARFLCLDLARVGAGAGRVCGPHLDCEGQGVSGTITE